jgi:hypothetical protein
MANVTAVGEKRSNLAIEINRLIGPSDPRRNHNNDRPENVADCSTHLFAEILFSQLPLPVGIIVVWHVERFRHLRIKNFAAL